MHRRRSESESTNVLPAATEGPELGNASGLRTASPRQWVTRGFRHARQLPARYDGHEDGAAGVSYRALTTFPKIVVS